MVLSAKDNELIYVWRRGGVCQECHFLVGVPDAVINNAK